MRKTKSAVAVMLGIMLFASSSVNCLAATSITNGSVGGYRTEGGSSFSTSSYYSYTSCGTDASVSLNGTVRFVRPYDGATTARGIGKSAYATEVIVRGSAPSTYNVLSMVVTHKAIKNGTWTGVSNAQ